MVRALGAQLVIADVMDRAAPVRESQNVRAKCDLGWAPSALTY
jgi:hypothetical protein